MQTKNNPTTDNRFDDKRFEIKARYQDRHIGYVEAVNHIAAVRVAQLILLEAKQYTLGGLIAVEVTNA